MHKNAQRDTLIINTVLPTKTEGKVYTGDKDSNTSLPVHGATGAAVGNFVCTSGSYTGIHCPIKVEAVNLSIPVSGGQTFKPMVKATHISGKVAVGKGDSGGPVITWALFAPSSTNVVGTISAGSGSLGACGNSSQCFSTVYFADIAKTMSYYASVNVPITILTMP